MIHSVEDPSWDERGSSMSEACPLTPPAEARRQFELLRNCKTIAVVGMSPNPDRPSYEVGLYLQSQGFDVVPIHPKAERIGGLPAFKTLGEAAAAGKKIDLADLFVSAPQARPVIEDASRLGIPAVWFQPGAEDHEAEARAQTLGLTVVTRACTMAVHMRETC